MTDLPLSNIEKSLFQACKESAAKQVVMPSNQALADRLGFSSSSQPSQILSRLERRGLIAIARFQTGREVSICATGQKTRWDGPRSPHHSAGGRRQSRPVGLDRAPISVEPRREILPVRVDRDPCFCCGVRRDVGCHHHPKGN